jgi:DNA-binding MarR family transcriptional regulator
LSRAPQYQAFAELVDETRGLFHQLRRAAQQLHQGDELTAARRGVLQSLQRGGAMTVPQMARERPVSRQHIQVLVNDLLQEGLVELRDNPAHKRSRLVQLTAAGKDLIDTMLQREERAVAALGIDVSPDRLRDAVQVLRQVRQALALGDWGEAGEQQR